MKLPRPSCPIGYTDDDLLKIMGSRLSEFYTWMRGQTSCLCDGRRYDHDKQAYEVTECSPGHGIITYTWDVERFLRGLPVID